MEHLDLSAATDESVRLLYWYGRTTEIRQAARAEGLRRGPGTLQADPKAAPAAPAPAGKE